MDIFYDEMTDEELEREYNEICKEMRSRKREAFNKMESLLKEMKKIEKENKFPTIILADDYGNEIFLKEVFIDSDWCID